MDNQLIASSGFGKTRLNSGKLGNFAAYPEVKKCPFEIMGVEERWIDKPGTGKERQLVDKDTGEAFVMTMPVRRIKVSHDPAKYVKVFRDRDIEKLTGSAKLVLFYCVYALRMNRADITLHWLTVGKWCGFSKSSFYNAVKELLDADILAIKLKKDDSYWVNPDYIFNGNRTKFAPLLK